MEIQQTRKRLSIVKKEIIQSANSHVKLRRKRKKLQPLSANVPKKGVVQPGLAEENNGFFSVHLRRK